MKSIPIRWMCYLLAVWIPVLNLGATSNQKIDEVREPLVEMLKRDNLTTRENALKVFVRDNASLHPRARSLRTPLQQEIECRFGETLIGRDYPAAFRRFSGAS